MDVVFKTLFSLQTWPSPQMIYFSSGRCSCFFFRFPFFPSIIEFCNCDKITRLWALHVVKFVIISILIVMDYGYVFRNLKILHDETF